MDRSVRPGDDFFAYVNGDWARRTAIPADRSSYGVLVAAFANSEKRVAAIIGDELPKPDSRMASLYRAYLDEAGVEAKGLTPIAPTLRVIADATDRDALSAVMGRLMQEDVDGLVDHYVSADPHDPKRYVVRIEQAPLGMPARANYLAPGAVADALRQSYQAYLAATLSALGGRDAESRAAAVLALETKLAQAGWTDAERRDASKTYNARTLEQLATEAPGIDWKAYLAATGVPADAPIVVAEPSALIAEAAVWSHTPLPVLKDWLTLATMKRYASYLPHAVADLRFGFFGRTLGGAEVQPTRAVSGARLVSNELRDDVGREYARRYFTAQDKAGVEAIVTSIKAAYRTQLETATWLSSATRRLAIQKLDHAEVLIGYPDKWRDYSSLMIRPDDLVGDVQRAEIFEHRHHLAELGTPVDRREFTLPVTAAGGVAEAELVNLGFPAGMLQAPIYDRNADPAVNYGAVGAIIGHELSHLFDDQGRKYDPDGRLRDWWTPAEVAQYTRRADRLVTQYEAYEPLPGLHLNGRVEQGENLADLLGLRVALDGYHLAAVRPATIDGWTGDQRFFLGFGQLQRSVTRPEQLRAQIVGDVHAPAVQRVYTVRNLDDWYTAFGVATTDRLFLKPANRVRVW
jgi:putative endopeptidase